MMNKFSNEVEVDVSAMFGKINGLSLNTLMQYLSVF